jgi:hypothetical protein
MLSRAVGSRSVAAEGRPHGSKGEGHKMSTRLLAELLVQHSKKSSSSSQKQQCQACTHVSELLGMISLMTLLGGCPMAGDAPRRQRRTPVLPSLQIPVALLPCVISVMSDSAGVHHDTNPGLVEQPVCCCKPQHRVSGLFLIPWYAADMNVLTE